MFYDNIKNSIKDLDITYVINKYVSLKKIGNNLFGLCPFHNEKTPSFSVNCIKKKFFCFGCKEHGDVIDFIIKYKNLNFKEALLDLNINNDINIYKKKIKKKKNYKFISDNNKYIIFDLMKKIATYYNKLLKKNKYILNYLINRGLNEYILNKFNIGYVDSFSKNIQDKFFNYSSKIFFFTGIIKYKHENDKIFSFNILNNRIIFPIINIKGVIVGFAGRNLNNKNKPKYLNSFKTYFFKKNKLLYGIWEAKKFIFIKKYVIVVEGYIDVLMLQKNKIKNVVGLMGSFVTKYQMKKIFNMTNNIIVCLDSDLGGFYGVKNFINIFLSIDNSLNKHLKFLILPKNFDPDKFLRDFGRNEFLKKLKISYNLYYIIYKIYIKNIFKNKINIILYLLNLKNLINITICFNLKLRIFLLLSKNLNINLYYFIFIINYNNKNKNSNFSKIYFINYEIYIIEFFLIFPNIVLLFNKTKLMKLINLFLNKNLFIEILNFIYLNNKINFLILFLNLLKSSNFFFFKDLVLKNKNLSLSKLLNFKINFKIYYKISMLNFLNFNFYNFYNTIKYINFKYKIKLKI